MRIEMTCPCLRAAAIFLILISAGLGICAEGDILWFRTYGGAFMEEPFALLPTENGGWIVGAETNSFGAGSDDIWLIRLDSDGDSLWSNTYGDIYPQVGRELIQAATGGWLVVVNSAILGPPWLDAGLIRCAAGGDTLWTWQFNFEGVDELVDAIAVGDGFLGAGQTEFLGAGDLDQWLLRFDAYGDTLWTRSWGGVSTDQATMLLPTPDGGSLLIGNTASFNPNGQDITIWRNDDLGNSLWVREYRQNGAEQVYDAVPVAEGGWLLACHADGVFGQSLADIWLLRVSEEGQELWSKFYGGPNDEYVEKILPTADAGWLLAGMNYLPGPFNPNIYLLRVDANGDSLWSRSYGTAFPEGMSAAIMTPDSGCLLGGWVFDAQADQDDWWILKTDENGDSLWSITFGDSLWDDLVDIVALTPEGNYLIAGETRVNGAGMTDIGLMCLEGPGAAVAGNSATQPFQFSFEKPHPNPFNAAALLSFQLPVASIMKLAVYDLSGRQVASLVNGWRGAGSHEVNFDGAGLSSGIYLAKLDAGNFTATQKMVLMK